MNYSDEYKQKLRTPEQAVQVGQNGGLGGLQLRDVPTHRIGQGAGGKGGRTLRCEDPRRDAHGTPGDHRRRPHRQRVLVQQLAFQRIRKKAARPGAVPLHAHVVPQPAGFLQSRAAGGRCHDLGGADGQPRLFQLLADQLSFKGDRRSSEDGHRGGQSKFAQGAGRDARMCSHLRCGVHRRRREPEIDHAALRRTRRIGSSHCRADRGRNPRWVHFAAWASARCRIPSATASPIPTCRIWECTPKC